MINNTLTTNAGVFKSLIDHGADINQKCNNNSPLLLSIKKKRVDYIKILLKELTIPDLNKSVTDGRTVIESIIDSKIDDEEIFNILFEKRNYIHSQYFNSNKKIKLIDNNNGLIRSIINNGFLVKNDIDPEQVQLVKTPLIYFIEKNNNNMAEILLKNKVSIEETDEEGFTPIFHIIKNDNKHLFNILLEKYHPDISKMNNMGQTPLQYAQYLGETNQTNDEFYITKLENYRIENNDLNRVPLENNDNQSSEKIYKNVLMMPILKKGKYKLAKKILKSKNSPIYDLNVINVNQETPLIYMINDNTIIDKDIVDLLIKRGADITVCYKNDTPLILSIKNKKYEYAKIILDNMSKDSINHLYNGKTLMSILIENSIDNENLFNTLFEKEAYIDYDYFKNNSNNDLFQLIENNPGLIKSMIRHGFYLKKNDTEISCIMTPLIYFIKNNKNQLVVKFLENNANVDEIDAEDGATPIIKAVKNNNIKLFNLLINKYQPNITIKDNMGKTPLMYALQMKNNKGSNRNLFIFSLKKYNEKYLFNLLVSYIKKGKFKTARELLETYSDLNVNLSNGSNEFPIILMIRLSNSLVRQNEYKLLFKMLIDRGADFTKTYGGEKDCPFLLCVKNQRIDLIKILVENPSFNVQQLYNGKTVMTILIEYKIDNSTIYFSLFEREAYIDHVYLSNDKNARINLIEQNDGLIKCISIKGFYIKKKRSRNSCTYFQSINLFHSK